MILKARKLCNVRNEITQFLPVTHTFYTRKGRARPGTLHPQRISERCSSVYRPRKDGSLSQAICPRVVDQTQTRSRATDVSTACLCSEVWPLYRMSYHIRL